MEGNQRIKYIHNVNVLKYPTMVSLLFLDPAITTCLLCILALLSLSAIQDVQ